LHSCALENGIIKITGIMEEILLGTDNENHYSINLIHKKGKVGPLQAWGGPEGSRNLRFPDFLTMAQDGGKVVSLKHQPHLPPGNTPDTQFC
jgi:hypothetical protein